MYYDAYIFDIFANKDEFTFKVTNKNTILTCCQFSELRVVLKDNKPTLIIMVILSLRHLGNLAKKFWSKILKLYLFYSNCYLHCLRLSLYTTMNIFSKLYVNFQGKLGNKSPSGHTIPRFNPWLLAISVKSK